jgi:hypothetical protein
MPVPENVLRFQVLLYLSLALDALSMAFQDRTPTGSASDTTILAATTISACMIVLFAWLVRHAARARKSWPRWVLTAALVLSALSLLPAIRDSGLQFDTAVELVSCILTAAGLYFSFTGDARGWFNA